MNTVWIHCNYRLDPCNCVSSPGFSWNKMFNTNNVTFFSNFVMDFFLEKRMQVLFPYIVHERS